MLEVAISFPPQLQGTSLLGAHKALPHITPTTQRFKLKPLHPV